MAEERNVIEYVNVEPLDDMILHTIPNNAKIRLLKIDVEGAELEVLEGARKVLQLTKYLMIEIMLKNKNDALRLLKLHNFRLVDMKSYKDSSNMLFKNIII